MIGAGCGCEGVVVWCGVVSAPFNLNVCMIMFDMNKVNITLKYSRFIMKKHLGNCKLQYINRNSCKKKKPGFHVLHFLDLDLSRMTKPKDILSFVFQIQ